MSFDYRGFFHIHSSFSHDGTTDIKGIIKSAKKCGADFIIVTDHFNMKAKEEGFEGYHDGLLVICGEEISPAYNHYLAVGIKKPVLAETDENPQIYIDAVKKDGGAGLIAHPDHTGAKLFGIRSYPWKDWSVKGYDSISIWDLMTDWQEKLTSYFKAFFAVVFPSFILSGPKKETLERWDALNMAPERETLISGYGEIDNHNIRKKAFGITFRIFPFDFAFKTISTHVLLKDELSKDAETAKRQIVEAVKSSSIYAAQESGNNAKGFEFYMEDDLRKAESGESLTAVKNPKVVVKLPKKALIKIIHNGNVLFSKYSDHLEKSVCESGIYRIEVYRKKYFILSPWIFSNHIRIK
ncbi:MAG: PHP domain-containing protein [Endomicrobia bacterium]|nr:PHP domain-containing protein [Endomicrobiia bacterium]MCL2144809.1 PHP domain-containing protein [Endomicrobiia bacterium]